MVDLHLGDCLEIMPSIADESVDMILADLPYGVTQNGWDVVIPMDQLWREYRRIIKPNGAIVLTATQPFAADLIMAARDLFRYDLVWHKVLVTGFLNANRMPLRSHELVLVFYKGLPTYNPQKSMGRGPTFHENKNRSRLSSNYGKFNSEVPTGSKDGTRHPTSVFSIKYEPDFFDASVSGKRIAHPT